jgi:hypothetical protein
MALHLGGLLGQDVTLEGLAALDAATARTEKRFLAPLLVFILGIYMLLNDMLSGGSRREHFDYPKALMGTAELLLTASSWPAR